ncbi:MAG: heme biosynthesis HemY N-terminal domain-containing protein [Gammaproteobacteria bacterium]|nr:heme biosynthesis HemY N-terminal domain-containing protein [Gammaproteobacteria bacterium]
MIKLFAWSLVVIAVALTLSLVLGFPQDPGYLLIAFGSNAFETSLFALLVAACVIYAVVKLLFLLLGALNPWRLVNAGRRLKARRRANAKSSTVQGILDLVRGDWQSSLKLLGKGLNEDDASVLTALAGAHAAERTGDVEAALSWLDKGLEAFPEAAATINTLRAEILLRAERLDDCVSVLQTLNSNSPSDTNLLRLLHRVYFKLEDWAALERLLPALKKFKALPAGQLQGLEDSLVLASISQSSSQSSNTPGAVEKLTALWKKAQASQRENPELVAAYAQALLQSGDAEGARRALEKALMKRWDSQTVLCYGALEFGAQLANKQLLKAESWQRSRPNDAALLLTLARLSLRCELWGKAREYYATTLGLESNAAAYVEYAGLLKALGLDEEADAATREALAGTGLALPVPQRAVMGKD